MAKLTDEKIIIYDVDVETYLDTIIFKWRSNAGYGRLVTNRQLMVIDDEYMGEDFAQEVIEYGMRKIGRIFGKWEDLKTTVDTKHE